MMEGRGGEERADGRGGRDRGEYDVGGRERHVGEAVQTARGRRNGIRLDATKYVVRTVSSREWVIKDELSHFIPNSPMRAGAT